MSRRLSEIITPTPEEDAVINAGIAADPDASEASEASDNWFATAMTSEEAVPHILARYRRTRGRQKAPTKLQVHIRLDADIVEHFRSSGSGWQTRLNDTLRRAVFSADAQS
ncbi:MAG: BrnA antitoxin family protein [Chloroflexota bacterium]|nr:BrnA antitoxin family protein [Chloroflexota bacterium]MDE2960887.1 BrnA antitoxin family protein [Chloroflexota bacterium]